MINRVKEKLHNNFTIIPNELFNGALSAKAVGVFAYLCSRPDNWKFNQNEIKSHFNMGIDAVRSALKELEENKLLLRYRERKENGKMGNMIYILFPNDEDFTKVGKSNVGNGNIGKFETNNIKYSNKDYNNTNPSFINIEGQENPETGKNDFEDLQPLNDKELENSYNLQVLIKQMNISLSDVKKLIAYRKVLKKPLKTMRGLIGLLRAIKNTASATGKSFDEIFEIMMENEWQSIKPEYLIKKDTKTKKENETYFDEELGIEMRKGANWTDEDFEF